MELVQAIQQPFGITVFGSSIMRIAPDIVSLTFAVSRLTKNPKEAFQEARQATQTVRNYLISANIQDIGTSQITLSQHFRYEKNENRFAGYLARVSFHVLLHDLEQVQEVTAGIIEAGVNEIQDMEFQTTRLKELRAESRRRAIVAAREKAEIYCQAASVRLGRVIHIEDVNPDMIRGRNTGHHSTRETSPTDEEAIQAFDPGSIVVGAAVMVAFEIASEG